MEQSKCSPVWYNIHPSSAREQLSPPLSMMFYFQTNMTHCQQQMWQKVDVR